MKYIWIRWGIAFQITHFLFSFRWHLKESWSCIYFQNVCEPAEDRVLKVFETFMFPVHRSDLWSKLNFALSGIHFCGDGKWSQRNLLHGRRELRVTNPWNICHRKTETSRETSSNHPQDIHFFFAALLPDKWRKYTPIKIYQDVESSQGNKFQHGISGGIDGCSQLCPVLTWLFRYYWQTNTKCIKRYQHVIYP